MAASADILEMYHLGAGSHNVAQTDPDISFGAFRSSTRAHSLGFIILNGIPNVNVIVVSGNNGIGAGSISATGTGSLAWTAPGSTTQGTPVAIANGETKVLKDGQDVDKFVIVDRTSATDFDPSAMTVLTQDIFNNVFGKDNWIDAEQDVGDTEYRAVGLLNDSASETFTLKIFLGQLGTAAIVDASGYGAAGAVNIDAKAGTDFDDWPDSGAIKNTDTGEVMYYASRTDSRAVVAASGRDIWSDVSGGAAGSLDDTILSIPVMQLAYSIPFGQPTGTFQSPADEGTDPIPGYGIMPYGTGPYGDGVSVFGTPTSESDAAVVTIAFGTSEQYALWMKYQVVAGATAEPSVKAKIEMVMDATFDIEADGRNRIQDSDLVQYLLFRGVGSEPDPDSDSPFETFASLPHTTAALAISTIYFFVLRQQNDYGVVSKNINSWRLELDGSGDQVAIPPSAPELVQVVPAAAGTTLVDFDYRRSLDSVTARADTFAVWFTTDGSTPDTSMAADATELMTFKDNVARLRYTVVAQLDGVTVKVTVRTRNSGTPDIDSTNTDVQTSIADTDGPAAPGRATIHHGDTSEEHND